MSITQNTITMNEIIYIEIKKTNNGATAYINNIPVGYVNTWFRGTWSANYNIGKHNIKQIGLNGLYHSHDSKANFASIEKAS